MSDISDSPAKARRGFAAMAPEMRRAIAARGGRGSAPQDRAFARSRDLAASAGREGGLVTGQRRFDSLLLQLDDKKPR